MAICTLGSGECGTDFNATRPQDFVRVKKYLDCVNINADSEQSDADRNLRCIAYAGIRFANSSDYRGPVVSVEDGTPIGSKLISAPKASAPLSIAVLNSNASPQSSFVPSAVFFIPKGTPVVVRAMQSVHSFGARTGSKFRFEVAQDVIYDGRVFAEAGDTAVGAVQEGQAGRQWLLGWVLGLNSGANLRFSVDSVFNFCGDTLHVDFDRTEFRTAELGFFLGNVDVTVAKGQKYVAHTDRPQRVCADPTSAEPESIPSDAIETSDH
jgi:hypothetical protein